MSGKSVLFVVRSYSGTGAQPIRFRQIIRYLAGRFDIHVLELTHGMPGVRKEGGITIHSLGYSIIGRILNPAPAGPPVQARGRGARMKILARIKRLARSLFFPDSVITEAGRLKHAAVSLVKEHGVDVTVLSAFPFSVLICARVLRRSTSSRIILDVGDPFFRNSRNGVLRDLIARRFEKKHLRNVDRLVVTNEMTRSHYQKSFNFPDQSAIWVIPMGVEESELRGDTSVRPAITSAPAGSRPVLVYAGQLYHRLREPFELYRAVEMVSHDEDFSGIHLDMYGSFSREFSAGFESSHIISFKGPVPHSEVARVSHEADVVVFIDNAYGMQTPGKVFEIAMIDRPVLFIADRHESPALEVVKGMGHIVITSNNSGAIAMAIRHIMSFRPEYPQAVRLRKFRWEERALQYNRLITGLSGEE